MTTHSPARPSAPPDGGVPDEEPLNKLLLVEDDPVDAERIQRWIRSVTSERWDVLWATTLSEARALLDEHEPVVALVDLTLPDAQHLDVVRSLRNAAPDCPIVVQTGVDDADTPLQALALGAQDYLPKDALSADGLLRALRYARTRHELVRTSLELADAAAELDDFAHVVAHDLRAPVRTARMLADRLVANLSARDDAMAHELGERLDDALLRLDTMVLAMLDYSGLRARNVEPQAVDLAEAVREGIAAVEGDLANIATTVMVDIADGISVRSNHALLHRVLVNVLSNAVKYRRAGIPLKLRIQAHAGPEDVVLRVTDNGAGINPADRERVFELLERLDTTKSGLGFGLAICRRIMKTLGGTIWIEANEPPGTTVTLSFPYADHTLRDSSS